jgi:hypothetical protein
VGLTAVLVHGPPGPHFTCHKALDGTIQQWRIETTNGVALPNVGGDSARSIAVLGPYLGDGVDRQLRDYGYVSGLQFDDPPDLVLFYLKQSSRRTWHGDTHWFTGPKRWFVLNPQWDALNPSDAAGEMGEMISKKNFETRLTRTLAFLRQEARPGWETAEQEHQSFLHSIGQ